MITSHVSSRLVVTVNGQMLPDNLHRCLSWAYVDDNLHLPSAFSLRFRDPDRSVISAGHFTIGATVDLAMLTSDETSTLPLISGEVTALEAEIDGGGTFTTVRGYDALHRLMSGTRTAVYADATCANVVRHVASRVGLRAGTVELPTGVKHHTSHHVQANVSDWAFLLDLANRNGCVLTVAREAIDKGPIDKAAINFTPVGKVAGGRSSTPVVLRYGADLLRFRAAVTGSGQVRSVQVHGWDDAAASVVTATAPTTAEGARIDAKPAKLAEQLKANDLLLTGPHRTTAEVRAVASAQAARAGARFAEFEGMTRGDPTLAAGCSVDVQQLGAPFDGTYVLTRVRHVIEPDNGYTTQIEVAGDYPVPSNGPAATGGGMSGVVCAVVVDVDDPQNRGRVRVHLPWLGDHLSDWARVVQLGAGHGRGTVHLPEVGDEVMVAFEHGRVDCPYVIGGLYSDRHPPPKGSASVPDVDRKSGQVQRRSFTTRTGHEIEYLDSMQKSGIWMRTGNGALELSLDGTETAVTVRSDGTVAIRGTRGVDVEATRGPLRLRSGARIELNADMGITLDGGSGQVRVTGQTVSVEGQGYTAVKGKVTSVEGTSVTEVKGGMTCAIRAAQVRIN